MAEAGAAESTVLPMGATDLAITALREQGADRLDPVRFHFIEALSRRTRTLSGEARRLLDARLEAALQACRHRLEQLAAPAEVAADDSENGDARRLLADLVARLTVHGNEFEGNAADVGDSPGLSGERLSPACGVAESAPAELKSLRYFRDSWSRLSVEQQLAEALAQAPENAGPLNSHLLMLRVLQRMKDLSPDYLNRFMSYVDALLWLEQADSLASSGGPPAATASQRPSQRPKKSPRQ